MTALREKKSEIAIMRCITSKDLVTGSWVRHLMLDQLNRHMLLLAADQVIDMARSLNLE